MSTILVDMDGVLADWGAGWDQGLSQFGSFADNIPRHAQQTSFNLMYGLTDKEKEVVEYVMADMDYFDLYPIDGAIDTVLDLHARGHEIRICTSPWLPNATCVRDKLDWIESHLGTGWSERVVITKDKTLVRGDFLIDDKPEITGLMTPEWQQILFNQPYNQHVTHLPRALGWDDMIHMIEEETE